jgi:hypothetical protein
VIGVEVTELCREAPRAEAGRLEAIVRNAQTQFERSAGAQPFDVIVSFSPRADELPSRQLTPRIARRRSCPAS